jgi:hypothetical protein
MARVFNGSSQYLSASSTLLSNEPIDVVMFANSDTTTAAQVAFCLGNNGASGMYSISFEGTTGGDPIRGLKQSDAGANGFADTASYSAATWYAVSMSLISDTSRAIFLNGTKTANTTNTADPSPDFITIGALRRSSVAAYFDGSISETYMLDVNMSDAQHALAGKGISPFWLVPGKNVRAWYPLQGHNNNRVRNGYPDLSATGSPTNGTHPARVMRPRINGVMAV